MAIQSGPKTTDAADQSVVKDQLNYLNSMHDAPAVRLDAEFFQADDIDGAGEGLTGSGNLNYLVLQSGQTQDSASLNNPFTAANTGNVFSNDALDDGASAGDATGRGYGNFSDDDSDTDLAGDSADVLGGGMGSLGSDIPALGSGMGVAGATALKAHGINGGDDFNQSSIDIANIDYPDTPEDPDDPKDPEDPPKDPEDPKDPPDDPPPGGDDYDLVLDVDTPILDVDLDVILDPIEDILGDIDIDIDAIISNILPGDHGILPDISASVDAVLDGTTLIGVDLSEILEPLDPLVSGVTNILDSVIGNVEFLLPDALVCPVTDLVNTVLDLTGLNGGNGDTDLLLNLGAIIPDFTTLDTALDVPLNPVEMLLGDIDVTVDAQALVEDLGTHLFAVIDDVHAGDIAGVINTVIGDEGILQNLDGVIPDLGLGLDVVTDILPDLSHSLSTDDLLGGLLGGGHPAPGADTDLALDTGIEIAGIEVPDINLDIPLDPVEEILDDIDVNIDLASVISGDIVTDILPELAEGDIGDVLDNVTTTLGLDTHLDLLNNNDLNLDVGTETVSDLLDGFLNNDQPAPGGDTDLVVDTNIEVLGIEVPDINLDIPLDPVEALIGDIDIDLDVASLTDMESVSDILHDALAGDIDGIIDDLGTQVGLDTHLDLLGNNDIMLDILPDNLADVISVGGGDALGGLGDAVGSLLGSPQIPDVLPEPVGTITEGLGGVIDTTPVLGGLGGLFHGHGGGLFG